MANQIDDLIIEREKHHGHYAYTAVLAQAIKAAWHDKLPHGNARRDPEFMEALDMISTKMARILAGDPTELDHWRDIQGYARLAEQAAERMRGVLRPLREVADPCPCQWRDGHLRIAKHCPLHGEGKP